MAEKENIEHEKRKISIYEISTDKINVRSKSDVFRDLDKLKHSIKYFGLLQNIVVTDYIGKGYKYELVAGQRRLEAFKQLFKETKNEMYTKIDADYIPNIEETRSIILSFEENVNRNELTYEDKKRVFEILFKKYGNIKDVAEAAHTTTRTVNLYLKKDEIIPVNVIDLVNKGELSRTKAREIAEAFEGDEKKISEIADIVSKKKLTNPQYRNVIEIGHKEPKSNVSDIIHKAKMTKRYKLIIYLTEYYWDKLNEASKERDENREDTAKNAIVEWLKQGGMAD